MVDNTTLNSGTGGDVIATDDIGGVKYQRVKLVLGADNTNDGDVASGNPMPVDDAGGSLTVDNAALSVTGGGTETGALRVTLANNSTGVVSVDDNGGALTVDGTVTADAGTGPWPVTDNSGSLTVDSPADATDGGAHGASQTGFRVMGTDGTNDQQISVNSTGHVNIADGGNVITVDGTVTANAGTGPFPVSDNAGSLTVDATELTTLAGAVSGTEMQVDVVAPLPAGTNGIGKLTANSGVDIGDVDVTSISAGSNLIGDVGLSGARTSGGTTLYKNIDVDESEDAVKASAGQVYWIHAMNLSAATKFLKFYNATVATVIVGTTTPDLTFPLATQGDTNGAGFTLSIPNGIAFDTAITIAATTGVADNDSGAPGANEVVVNLGYA